MYVLTPTTRTFMKSFQVERKKIPTAHTNILRWVHKFNKLRSYKTGLTKRGH